MKINVNVNDVKIIDRDLMNTGEYNVHNCNFIFTDEFNGLEIKAVFKNKNGTYETSVVNNQAKIPEEVLNIVGMVEIGVYAYTTENNTLILRYSPKPDRFFVDSGTYKEGISPVVDPTTTEFEQLQSRVATIEGNYITESEATTLINNAVYGALEGVY